MPSIAGNNLLQLQKIVINVEVKEYKETVSGALTAGVYGYPVVFEQQFELKKFNLNVFVQGNLEERTNKPIFLTVHDIGKTFEDFVKFFNNKAMAWILENAIFVHISLPGQEPGAEDLNDDFPNMDVLGDGLIQVLQKLEIEKCIAIGEGAGADIVCRFAIAHPECIHGMVLIHCTSTTHGVLEHLREIFANLKLSNGEMSHSAWNYLLTHRYGHHKMDAKQQQYVYDLKEDQINEKNLSKYIYAFAHRNDFTDSLKDNLSGIHSLLITGSNSPHNENIRHMYDNMEKSKTGLLIVENAIDVLEEAPDYVTTAFELFCKKNEILSSGKNSQNGKQ